MSKRARTHQIPTYRCGVDNTFHLLLMVGGARALRALGLL